MKPDFKSMSRDELRAYVLEHRDDLEAIRVLFHVAPDAQIQRFPPMFTKDGTPIEENIRIAEEAMRQRLEETDR
ncbi:MAG: hypothetical protein VKK04_01290 [Synechococcales bacterium]|nr:hypothetical protein [Synechococcales bacterium]